MKRLQRALAMLLLLALVLTGIPVVPVAAEAVTANGTCGDGLTWEVKDTTLIISGTGAMDDFTTSTQPWKDYRYTITSIIVQTGVTSIGKNAFNYCQKVTQISLPDTLTTVAYKAFYKAAALADVYYAGTMEQWDTISVDSECGTLLDAKLYVQASFGICGEELRWQLQGGVLTVSGTGAMDDFTTSTQPWKDLRNLITSVVIKKGITSIGKNAFNYCQKVTEVSLPKTVTAVFYKAFYKAVALKNVYFDGTQAQWDQISIADENTYLTSAKLHLAANTELASGTCGDALTWSLNNQGVLTVSGTGAMTDFARAEQPWDDYRAQIKSIVIVDGVTTIGTYAFYYCNLATSVTIPETVTKISKNAMLSCKKLSQVNYASSAAVLSLITETTGNSKLLGATLNTAEPVYKELQLTAPSKLIYQKDEPLDLSDMVVKLVDANGTAVRSEDYFVVGYDATYLYDQTVAIVCQGLYATFTVNVRMEGDTGKQGDNIHWILTNDTMTLSGTGEMADLKRTDASFYGDAQRQYVKKLVVGEGITYLGKFNFYYCYRLVSANLPLSLTKVGSYCFEKSGLRSVDPVTGSYVYAPMAYARYAGTEHQWNQVVIGATNNEALINTQQWFFQTAKLESVAITKMPNKVEYALGEALDLTGMELTGYYHDGTQKVFGPEEITVTGYKPANPATQTLKAYYNEKPGLTVPMEVEVCDGGALTDTVNWTLEENVLTISGEGAMPDIGTGPWNAALANYIYEIVVEEGITSLGKTAFYYAKTATTVRLPSTLKSVAANAFKSCNGLTDVYYAGSESQWNKVQVNATGNTKLTGATIYFGKEDTTIGGDCGVNVTWEYADGVLTISGTGAMDDFDDVFFAAEDRPWGEYVDEITKVVVEDGITRVGAYAFDSLYNVTQIELADSVAQMGESALSRCYSLTSVELPANLTAIEDLMFDYDMNLQSVTIPDGVTSIGQDAFNYCQSLRGIEIPETVTSIGSMAFYQCAGLQSIEIPDSVTFLGVQTFAGCTNLQTITLSKNLESFEISTIDNCGALTDIYFNGTAQKWRLLNRNNPALPETVTVHFVEATDYPTGSCGENLTWAFIDGTLIVTGEGAMDDYSGEYSLRDQPWAEYCEEIYFVEIGDGVTYIGENAFWVYENLCSVDVGAKVSVIGSSAFANCQNLRTIYLPKSLTRVESYAFYSTELANIYYRGSETKWEKVQIGEENDPIYGANLHFMEAKLEGVTTTAPNKTEYRMGEALDLTGMVVTAIYADGTTETVTDYTVSGYDPYTVGQQTVTVTYEGYELSFDVLVTLGGACGEDVFWKLTDGVLTVYGTGAMADYFDYENGDFLDRPWQEYESSITRLVVEEGITEIGAYAFFQMSALRDVTIAEGVETIGESAFSSCDNLEQVQLPTTVTVIDDYAFWYDFKLQTVALPEGLQVIGASAFDSTGLQSITLPRSLTTIGKSAFSSSALTTVTIPENVTEIGEQAFRYCSNLTGIWVDENNPNYSSDNSGVLFNKEKTVLLQAPAAKTGVYDVPAGVTAIAPWSFVDCDIEQLTLPEGVTEIGEGAFWLCDKLQIVTLPESLQTVGAWAFDACKNVNTVCYGGSATGWTEVRVDEGNECLTGAAFQYAKRLLTRIEVYPPQKTHYLQGEELDTTGMVVSAVYDDDTTEVITEGYTVSGYDANVAGTQTITVTYEGFTDTFPVTVEQIVLIGIYVSAPHKTEYAYGEELDLTGMTVTGNYSDGSSHGITDGYTVTGFDPEVVGQQWVSVTYEGCSMSFCVTVAEPVPEVGQLILDKVTGKGGDTVQVKLTLADNPGITCAKLKLTFDSEVLTLTEVTDGGILGEAVHKPELASPYTLCWANDLATQNFTANGTLVILTFAIAQDAPAGEYPITISYGTTNGDIMDADLMDVPFEVTDGAVTVEQTQQEEDDGVAKLVLSSVSCTAGETVEVKLSIKNNPGIASAKLKLNFDSSVLTLTEVADGGILGTAVHKPELASPYTLCWVNDLATENFTQDGTLVTLRFAVAEDAPAGDYALTLSYGTTNGDIMDADLNDVAFTTVQGNVTVK